MKTTSANLLAIDLHFSALISVNLRPYVFFAFFAGSSSQSLRLNAFRFPPALCVLCGEAFTVAQTQV
jgi:hypothetical protein